MWKILLTYRKEGLRKYESLIKQCEQCETQYIDTRCHEIAIEGIPEETFRLSSYVILTLIGGFMLRRGITQG